MHYVPREQKTAYATYEMLRQNEREANGSHNSFSFFITHSST